MADVRDRTDSTGTGVDLRKGAFWWAALRIAIGLVFLWAFADKLVGLGFDTCRAQSEAGEYGSSIDYGCDASFVRGGAPTYGFLEFGTEGSHTGDLFQWMAPAGPTSPNPVDWVFMGSLLAIGVGLTLGVATRLAAYGGVALLVFMYLAGFVWPDHHPFLDDHLIYAIALLGVASVGGGRDYGLGERWNRLPLVERFPLLRS